MLLHLHCCCYCCSVKGTGAAATVIMQLLLGHCGASMVLQLPFRSLCLPQELCSFHIQYMYCWYCKIAAAVASEYCTDTTALQAVQLPTTIPTDTTAPPSKALLHSHHHCSTDCMNPARLPGALLLSGDEFSSDRSLWLPQGYSNYHKSTAAVNGTQQLYPKGTAACAGNTAVSARALPATRGHYYCCRCPVCSASGRG